MWALTPLGRLTDPVGQNSPRWAEPPTGSSLDELGANAHGVQLSSCWNWSPDTDRGLFLPSLAFTLQGAIFRAVGIVNQKCEMEGCFLNFRKVL
jgi:hypothetical protein